MAKKNSHLDELQIELSEQIVKALPKSIILDKIYDSCTIDIVVEVGTIAKSGRLSQGRFRVFWGSDRNYKIGYLPAGLPFYDGYEVQSGRWQYITLDDVLNVYNKDVSNLADFHKKYLK